MEKGGMGKILCKKYGGFAIDCGWIKNGLTTNRLCMRLLEHS